MSDYLVEIDLNPPTGPITSSLDPRAMRYFGFESHGQQLELVQPLTGEPRVFASFGFQPPGASQPQPPVDVVLDFSSGLSLRRYDENYDRRYIIVWLDPASPLPTGPCVVRISAWSRT